MGWGATARGLHGAGLEWPMVGWVTRSGVEGLWAPRGLWEGGGACPTLLKQSLYGIGRFGAGSVTQTSQAGHSSGGLCVGRGPRQAKSVPITGRCVTITTFMCMGGQQEEKGGAGPQRAKGEMPKFRQGLLIGCQCTGMTGGRNRQGCARLGWAGRCAGTVCLDNRYGTTAMQRPPTQLPAVQRCRSACPCTCPWTAHRAPNAPALLLASDCLFSAPTPTTTTPPQSPPPSRGHPCRTDSVMPSSVTWLAPGARLQLCILQTPEVAATGG